MATKAICASCKKNLNEMASVRVGDKWYHKNCFICAGCRNQLATRFFIVEEKSYCDKCHADKFTPKCKGCNNSLEGAVCVSILGQDYHKQCAKCAKCNKVFENGRYYPFQHMAYCFDCHWQARRELAKHNQTPANKPAFTKAPPK